jgi:hypothetical protein
MSGFITLSRKFFKHSFWAERREFSLAEAWLDLLQAAQWQPCKQLVKGKLLEVGRGELLASHRYLQERWGWRSLTKVQSFIKMLCDEGMIRSEFEGVTSRISICKYDSYNVLEVGEKSDKGQLEVGEKSEKSQLEVKDNNNNKINKINKINKETTPMPQAGGFDFEKLARKVGRTCAKLMTDGEVGTKLPAEKKPLLLKWLGYRHEKGSAITTTVELAEVLGTWLEKDSAILDAAISKSIGAGWKVLVFDAPKPTDKKPVFPNYWKPGIEVELNLTPEQTNEYYRHLIGLRWYKTTEAGKPYWNRPASQEPRTGESYFSTIAKTSSI